MQTISAGGVDVIL